MERIKTMHDNDLDKSEAEPFLLDELGSVFDAR